MTEDAQLQSRLEEARDILRDLALPPGYHVGKDPDGNYMVVKESTSEIFAIDGTEEDLPAVFVDLWRDYVNEAAPSVVCRLIHTMTATDAMLTWKGELSGGPKEHVFDNDLNETNYQCALWGKGGDENEAVLGWDDDPIEAILKARREMLASLEEAPELGHDPDDELDEDSQEPQEG